MSFDDDEDDFFPYVKDKLFQDIDYCGVGDMRHNFKNQDIVEKNLDIIRNPVREIMHHVVDVIEDQCLDDYLEKMLDYPPNFRYDALINNKEYVNNG